jgi:Head domain of trimeric autotransporter adhesin
LSSHSYSDWQKDTPFWRYQQSCIYFIFGNKYTVMKRTCLLILLTIIITDSFSQNVGIGTATPITKLHVSGTAGNIATFNGGSSMWITLAEGGVNRGYIGSFSGNAEDVDFGTYSGNTIGKIHFVTIGTPRLSVLPNGHVGIGTVSPAARLHVTDSSVLFSAINDIPGSPGNLPISGVGRRMMWYADKAAFRVGYVDATQWDKDSIGNYSFAAGYNSKSKGYASTALGFNTSASAFSSTAMGNGTSASGYISTAMGNGTSASGDNSTAMGIFTSASGYYSTAMGSSTSASGYFSTAMGSSTLASGDYSTAMGFSTSASGTSSTAMGYFNKSKSFAGTVVGVYNDSTNAANPSSINSNNRIFQIGNGTANNARSNAMTVLQNGNVGIGELTPAVPLNFASALGNKISLWGNTTNHYGMGIQSNLMQFYVPSNGDDMAFGYGNSNAFTERMRIKGNGKVGIGTTSPNASATLDVSSTTGGFLFPRMTTAQRNAIASPAAGLQIYNTDRNCLEIWNSSGWMSFCENGIFFNDIAILQSPSIYWTQKADFGGTARYSAVGFSIGSKGYIGTGADGAFKIDFWEYDPATNVWTQKADFGGTARQHAVGFSIGSKGYIGTGNDGFGSVYKKDFWEYDPGSNAWTQKTDFGGTGRRYAVGFSIGSKGYIGTGREYAGAFKKDFWEYDPGSNAWTQKADFGGTARQNAVGFSISTKGYSGTGNDGSNKKDFWEYDPGANAWTQKTDFGGMARQNAVGFSIGTKGYIGTGADGAYKKDFWEYDPGANAWTQKADFGGTERSEAVGFSIGSKGYIGTGAEVANKKDFWEYYQ